MSSRQLSMMSESELATTFRELALRQYQANREDDAKTYTRVYWRLDAIRNELIARDSDQRRVLAPLLQDQNYWVRYQAALSLFVVAPQEARAALSSVQAQDADKVAQAYANGTSLALEKGTFPLR